MIYNGGADPTIKECSPIYISDDHGKSWIHLGYDESIIIKEMIPIIIRAESIDKPSYELQVDEAMFKSLCWDMDSSRITLTLYSAIYDKTFKFPWDYYWPEDMVKTLSREPTIERTPWPAEPNKTTVAPSYWLKAYPGTEKTSPLWLALDYKHD